MRVAYSVSAALRTAKTARRKKAVLVPYDDDRTRPMISGPKYPPRLVIETIMAMPAAAAVPRRRVVGRFQNRQQNDNEPAVRTDSTMIARGLSTGVTPKTSKPAAATRIDTAVCQRLEKIRRQHRIKSTGTSQVLNKHPVCNSYLMRSRHST